MEEQIILGLLCLPESMSTKEHLVITAYTCTCYISVNTNNIQTQVEEGIYKELGQRVMD